MCEDHLKCIETSVVYVTYDGMERKRMEENGSQNVDLVGNGMGRDEKGVESTSWYMVLCVHDLVECDGRHRKKLLQLKFYAGRRAEDDVRILSIAK